MKNFSNESVKRGKAIVKIILKRYVCPILFIAFCYIVGTVICSLSSFTAYEVFQNPVIDGIIGSLVLLGIGFIITLSAFFVTIWFVMILIGGITYISERTLLGSVKAGMNKIISGVQTVINKIKREPEIFKELVRTEMRK